MKIRRENYRPDEVATIFGVHVSTVLRWIEEGLVPAIRVTASTIRIPIEEFHRKFPELPPPDRD